jgi:hypothetical protein
MAAGGKMGNAFGDRIVVNATVGILLNPARLDIPA